MPVTGSPSILKGYHNSLIDGSINKTGSSFIDGSPVINGVKCQINRWGTCNRYTWCLQDCQKPMLFNNQ